MKKGILCLALPFVYSALLAQSDSTASLQSSDSLAAYAGDHLSTTVSAPAAEPAPEGPIYKLKPAIDIPVTAALTGFTIYGFSNIYSKESSSEEQIRNLRRSDLSGFDRWASYVYSEKAADASDIIFYAAQPLPALLFFDKAIRKDAGKIAFLYWETMAVTGLFYTGVPSLVDRYRPYVYKPNPGGGPTMGDKTDGNAKNSFFAGHTALVATSTFFIAKVYRDYHPNSPLRHYLFGGAALATTVTSYLRHRGGRHFPSDIVVGTAVGTLTGILVPHFHKNKLIKNPNLSIRPYAGYSNGLLLTYRFDKRK